MSTRFQRLESLKSLETLELVKLSFVGIEIVREKVMLRFIHDLISKSYQVYSVFLNPAIFLNHNYLKHHSKPYLFHNAFPLQSSMWVPEPDSQYHTSVIYVPSIETLHVMRLLVCDFNRAPILNDLYVTDSRNLLNRDVKPSLVKMWSQTIWISKELFVEFLMGFVGRNMGGS